MSRPGTPASAVAGERPPTYLRKLRQAKGLGLREAAARAGLNHGYLSQLERGRVAQPSPRVLRKLAEAYEEPYEVLMQEVGYLTDGPLTPNQARALQVIGEPTEAELEALRTVLTAIRVARRTDDEAQQNSVVIP